MAILVKICGLTTEEALDAAIEAGADLVGLVFFPRSPRHLGLQGAGTLARRVGDRAGIVALSVDADDALLADVVEAVRPSMLQLHGGEPPERVASIKANFRIPVMKALAIEKRADLGAAPAYARVCERLLFDARPPRGATRPGGLGRAFDWTLLHGVDPGCPFLVSGGLDASNVGAALRITHAQGVDVSSGVERAAGEKDPGKIRAFVQAARAAEREQQATSA